MSTTAPHQERPRSFALFTYSPYLILALAVFAAYGSVYANGFVYDDDFLIVNNVFLRSWHNLPTLFTTPLAAGSNTDGNFYRPLQSLLYLITYQLAGGASTVAFHVLNVTLHAITAMAMYHLGRKMGFGYTPTLLATLMWAVHPLNVEAVGYMSATADPLHTLLIITATTILLPDFSARRWLMATPFIATSLLSKESAICFPLLAMSILYFTHEKRLDWRLYLRAWPAALITTAFTVIHFALPLHGLPTPGSTEPTPTNFTPFATLPYYLRLILWPTGLHMEHDLPAYTDILHISVLAGLAMVAAGALLILKQQTAKSLPLSWGLLWFAGAMVPMFYTDTIVYEHWLYLPLVGLMLGAAESLARSTPTQANPILSGGAVVAAAILGLLTWNQIKVWHDPETFYSNIIAHDEPAIKAHINIGGYYMRQGDLKKAMHHYTTAITASKDTVPEAQRDMGFLLLKLNDGSDHTGEALNHLRRAIEINPNYYVGLQTLADFYKEHGDAAEAATYQARADKIRHFFKTDTTP